jgi:predicted amidohydrolase YtcJ
LGHDRGLLITGGPIWTGLSDIPWVEALAVRDGRVAAAGPLAQVAAALDADREALDLHGRAVFPAFQDAHCHPLHGGFQQRSCDLEGRLTPEGCLEAVVEYMRTHPDGGWMSGKGWSMETFPRGCPSRQLLDSVTQGRPACLTNRDGHSAWVNSAALALAGIDRDTQDPEHGRIERDAAGEPQGTLHEGAMALVTRLLPRPSEEEAVAALLQAQRHLHSLGISGWQDAMVDAEAERAYSLAAGSGRLTARVRLALWWERGRGLEQVEDLLERRTRLHSEGLDAGSVKIMLDGVMETYTAATLEPYLSQGSDGTGPGLGNGHLFLDPELARRATASLDRAGFQVHFHAIGDRAVRVALDAVEAARCDQPDFGSGPRHHIAHIQLIHPNDLGRFHELGVVANMQPFWACHEPQMDELTIPYLGPQRAGRQYPFRSLADKGAVLAGGSDWPVSTANPLAEIAVAVARAAPGGEGGPAEPFLPQERLPLAAAFSAFTAGSAYVNHLEASTGTLSPGKLADLVVLAGDPFRLEPPRLPQAEVELTMVGGRMVFDRGTV